MEGMLIVEAVVVGAMLVPIFMMVRLFVKNLYVALFVAGVAFHLIAEFSGLNNWYLDNSVAAKKRTRKQ